MVWISSRCGDGLMPLGTEKAALIGGGASEANYFGNGSLGDCQFGSSSITQSGDSTAIDTVLTTGSESGGPGSNSYGSQVPNDSACYETTVLNKSGSYDGDMWVGNFTNLTIDANVTLTTDQPGRGIFIYCTGNCTINGSLSMASRGGYSDPTVSGGSDSASVNASGLQLPMFTASGTDTLGAATFAGCGNAIVAAVAEQPAISGDGTIFTIQQIGGGVTTNSSGSGSPTADGSDGTSGAASIQTGGGGQGGNHNSPTNCGAGRAGTCFSGGVGGGGSSTGGGAIGSACNGAVTDYGGAGKTGVCHGNNTTATGGGAGNPGGGGCSRYCSGCARTGQSGIGGTIWLVVAGDLTIGAAGTIEAKGCNGGSPTWQSAGGGGSGGGVAQILYGGTLSNSGAITLTGGTGGGNAGAGGDGGYYTAQVSI